MGRVERFKRLTEDIDTAFNITYLLVSILSRRVKKSFKTVKDYVDSFNLIASISYKIHKIQPIERIIDHSGRCNRIVIKISPSRANQSIKSSTTKKA